MIIIVTTFWPAFIKILHLLSIDRIGPCTRRPLLEVVRHSCLLQGRQLLIVSPRKHEVSDTTTSQCSEPASPSYSGLTSTRDITRRLWRIIWSSWASAGARLIRVGQFELSLVLSALSVKRDGPPGLMLNVHRSSALSDEASLRKFICSVFHAVVHDVSTMNSVPISSRSGSLPLPC